MQAPPYLHPAFVPDAYDELSFWSSRFGALLFDNLELRRGIVGLDVACGAGFPLFELAHVHGPSSRFVGVDIWKEGLARAAKKIPVYGLTNVEVREADGAALPFDDASFDLITSNLGVNNFADPPAVLRECFRVARPGARIAITTNLTGHMAGFYDFYRSTLRQLGREDLLPALDAQEAHRGTRAEIERMLTDAGFTLTNVVESAFDLRFADGTAMLRHSLVQFFLGGWRSVTEEEQVWTALEQNLNDASPLSFGVPMLYAEAVKLPV
jgi:ubiquinone/menaquinone biosynthesis C-methylase UbiE